MLSLYDDNITGKICQVQLLQLIFKAYPEYYRGFVN